MYADFFFFFRIHPSTIIGVTVETNAVVIYLDYFIVIHVIPFLSRNRKRGSSRKRNGKRGRFVYRIKFILDPLGTLESGDSVDFR